MRYYDYMKIQNFITSNKDKIASVDIGMTEDWFWTAQSIFKDNEFIAPFPFPEDFDVVAKEQERADHNKYLRFTYNQSKDNPDPEKGDYERGYEVYKAYRDEFMDKYCIGGILGSTWATPVMEVNFKDGHTERFNCYIDDNEPPNLEQMNSTLNNAGVLSAPVNEYRSGLEIKDLEG